MRLTEEQANLIKSAVTGVLGQRAKVYLFGSRVDDSRRGGDIDLLIIPGKGLNADEKLDARLKIRSDLYRTMGDRKIDIVFQLPGTPATTFQKMARDTGIVL
ncbi:MAG: nucleotidyltransferase domain-containing protein [Gammaproteobacteria bacterium]|nr:nucleotidyltransferase domain-containing protein [Gammaproteobacteria bacterium]